MKFKFTIILFLTAILLLFSCSEKIIPDPPVLTDKWVTIYDEDAEGITHTWYNEFPSTNFSGSTWDDWQMPNARYRWHKQRFRTGELDSTSCYYLSCNTVASPSLIWLNGTLLDQVNYTESYVRDITLFLLENDYNNLVIRNEYVEESFGIHELHIEKNMDDTLLINKNLDYHSMPLYHESPNYTHDLIIYEAFTRHFSGGNFTGMQNMTSRLNQLGINMVWLMPIHPIGKSQKVGSQGSPYAVRDYFTTNSRYGSMTQFSSLRSMLHRNHIKLMLDAPITYSAVDHSWVRDYPNYYQKDDRGKMVQPVGYKNKDVFTFDMNNASLRGRMESYLDFWLEQGVDAFRLTGSKNVDAEVFQEFRDHFTDADQEPFLLSDGTQAEYLLFGLDAVNGDALYEAFRDISDGRANASLIGKTLAKEIRTYPEGSKILHYAENHETPRAMSAMGVKDHHLALFTIFSAPGIPMIYCGEELRDPPKMSLYSNTTVNWYKIHWPTYNLISKLSKFRKDSPVLTRGNLHQIADTKSVGGFSRRYRNETWFVLMNYSNTEQTYQIDVKRTVFSDGTSGVMENGKVKLKAKGYCIVK
ncbi:MAG: alpha-amylase family glycosyl hydrolase [Candidatus Marinimicrobia bacterium]|nr:alpha-amylase family glycosyl hydrolase [Candidatus Neomarinimicrobiota bacterium]